MFAIISAILFGVSSPTAKALIGSIDPWLLAGLLYLGSGIGMLVVHLLRTFDHRPTQLKISVQEISWLVGVIFFGGVTGPVLLMYGLSFTPASTASLLLNLEGVFTATLAWVVFKEHYDRRILIGMLAIVSGGVVLSWPTNFSLASLIGPLLVVGACLSWGIDNNLTRKISLNDPILVTLIKSLVAGATNLVIAVSLGARFPNIHLVALASTIGFLCYGLSIVCFILALRHLGASRTGAYFSSAPFVGAFISVALFHESITLRLAMAAVLMGLGIYLHLTETHEHEHTHTDLEHGHSHTHDEHHRHEHGPLDPISEPHTHKHRHTALTHSHRHFPDMHHSHSH